MSPSNIYKPTNDPEITETTITEDCTLFSETHSNDDDVTPQNKTTSKVRLNGNQSNAASFKLYDRFLGDKILNQVGLKLVEKTRTILEKFNINDKDSTHEFHILEVSAGTGQFTKHIYSNIMAPSSPFAGKCKLTVTDMSTAAITRARKALPPDHTDNITFLGGVVMANLSEIEDSSVDLIISGFGLMFPTDKANVMKEF